MIKVTNRVPAYERNGSPLKGLPREEDTLLVDSHGIDSRMVRLRIGELDLTVLGADLEAAIRNARNSNRH